MSLAARIALASSLFAVLVFIAAYFRSFSHAVEWSDDEKFVHLDGQSLIVAELWEEAGGCDETLRPELEGFTEDFFNYSGLAYRVECKDSDFEAQSVNFPRFEDDFPDDAGFYEVLPDKDGDDWMVVHRESQSARIRIAAASSYQITFWDFIQTREFALIFGAILLGAFILYGLARALLSPIGRLGKAAQGSNLDLQTLRTPIELVPLKNAILGFKDRESSADQIKSSQLDKERYFTANAAHELLTPLSAIKTEVQLQQRLVDDEEMKSWLGDLLSRVNRATHTVDQLMTLARLDPDSTPGEKSPVDIGMLMTEITEDYKDRLSSKFVTITQVFSGNNSVYAFPGLIETLLRNLISNAVKYTPVEGKIDMKTKADNGWLHITVSNSCDRLPIYLLDQMFDRFVRGPHEVEIGSGLGLAISQRIAQLHETELKPTIAPEKDKLTFSLTLPLA